MGDLYRRVVVFTSFLRKKNTGNSSEYIVGYFTCFIKPRQRNKVADMLNGKRNHESQFLSLFSPCGCLVATDVNLKTMQRSEKTHSVLCRSIFWFCCCVVTHPHPTCVCVYVRYINTGMQICINTGLCMKSNHPADRCGLDNYNESRKANELSVLNDDLVQCLNCHESTPHPSFMALMHQAKSKELAGLIKSFESSRFLSNVTPERQQLTASWRPTCVFALHSVLLIQGGVGYYSNMTSPRLCDLPASQKQVLSFTVI